MLDMSVNNEKIVLGRLTNNIHKVTKKKLPPDPGAHSLDEPLTVEDLLGIVQVLNSLSEDIDTFKQKINEKLTVATQKRNHM